MNPNELGISHGEWRPGQYEVYEWIASLPRGQIAIVESATGCHSAGTGILMYDGSIKNVENVIVGNRLMGPDSTPRMVLQLCHGSGELFEISPRRRPSFVINDNHILTLQRTNRSNKYPDGRDGEIVDAPFIEWQKQWTKMDRHLHKLFAVPVEFPDEDYEYPIEPYFLGVYLGDGSCSNSFTIHTIKPALIEEIHRQADLFGLYVRTNKNTRGRGKSHSLSSENRGHANPIISALRELDLFGETSGGKFIPHQYKVGSREIRLSILAGIMDTDGYLSDSCYDYDYASKSEQLANDVVFVARSLGLRASIRPKEAYAQTGGGGIYYRVTISGNLEIVPCRVPRRQADERRQIKSPMRDGFTVKPIGVGEYFGFTLDGDGRYLLDSFIVTHNSGKSAWPAAVGHDYKTIAVTESKSLQSQYSEGYNFFKLTGRGNHPCVNSERLFDTASADECLYSSSMHRCPVAAECPYLVQKELARSARRCTLNYAYWHLTANRKYEDGSFVWSKNYLFLDECHSLPLISLDHYATEIKPHHRERYGLATLPVITSGMPLVVQMKRVEPWIADCMIMLAERINWIGRRIKLESSEHERQRLIAELRRTERLRMQMQSTLHALRAVSEDWYISSGPAGFLARPLTARHVFPHLHLQDYNATTVLMSATVGSFTDYCQELGIQEYESILVPSRFPPEARPIRIYDSPRMSSQADEKDFEHQASIIAGIIQECPPNWGGIIHVTRKSESILLRNRLTKHGLGNRIWVPPGANGDYIPTDEQLTLWQERKQRVPNSIICTWNMHQGYDGLDEKINIVAKIPFLPYGAPNTYEAAWRAYSNSRYFYMASVKLVQALGRTRRGRDQDYDLNGEVNGVVAVVDGSFGMVKRFLSPDILDSLVEV